MSPETLQEREEISDLLRARQLDEAYARLTAILQEDPNDWNAIYLMGSCLQQSDKPTLAYQFFKRAALKRPDVREVWNNLGATCDTLQRFDEALAYYEHAIQLSPDYADAIGNKACALINMSQFENALDACNHGLTVEPRNERCEANKAYALLALERWGAGWEHYDRLLGDSSHNRKAWDYGLPPWRGERGAGVVVYGEQGLGDELMFASCMADMRWLTAEVVVECDKRLAGLFARSFPWAHVYGNRHQERTEWSAPHPVTHQCAIGSLPRILRPDTASFKGGAGAYLVPDPERVEQWRAVMAKSRPNIGIAWTGGRYNTGSKFRYISPSLLAPLFDAVDAKWWSLEYNDPGCLIEGTPIRHVSRATEAPDYDETAAFVAALDLVISVPTTVVNLAGGLGVETWLLRPRYYNWRFHPDPNPWHNSIVKQFNQRELFAWSDVISEVASALRAGFSTGVHRGRHAGAARLHGLPIQYNPPRVSAGGDSAAAAPATADNAQGANRLHF